jgi:hypothetical protein
VWARNQKYITIVDPTAAGGFSREASHFGRRGSHYGTAGSCRFNSLAHTKPKLTAGSAAHWRPGSLARRARGFTEYGDAQLHCCTAALFHAAVSIRRDGDQGRLLSACTLPQTEESDTAKAAFHRAVACRWSSPGSGADAPGAFMQPSAHDPLPSTQRERLCIQATTQR